MHSVLLINMRIETKVNWPVAPFPDNLPKTKMMNTYGALAGMRRLRTLRARGIPLRIADFRVPLRFEAALEPEQAPVAQDALLRPVVAQ